MAGVVDSEICRILDVAFKSDSKLLVGWLGKDFGNATRTFPQLRGFHDDVALDAALMV